MTNTRNYEDYLIQSLKDPVEARGYLNAALEDGDIDGFLEALRHVVEAQGGIQLLSEKTHKSRNSLYKTLSKNGNPYLKSANDILHELGFTLSVSVIRQ